MKMYNLGLSNFAGKCRIVMYEKGLNVEFLDAPGGPNSEDYKKINPTGKIPALETDDGQLIAESEVINEYLEDKYRGQSHSARDYPLPRSLHRPAGACVFCQAVWSRPERRVHRGKDG